ncbi:PQQ-binding-like beta-propeller repeat protein [Haloarchaeobius sp. DFWS5]|uniref:outer membrane protein assembly factor BamB family protein n=1 Tax=Haloarchaeobius sp. DFWS5 TaxID=3446114 RepID=UPI003EBB5177
MRVSRRDFALLTSSVALSGCGSLVSSSDGDGGREPLDVPTSDIENTPTATEAAISGPSSVRWQSDAVSSPATSPVVADGTVVVGAGSQGLLAYSTVDGSVQWGAPLDGTPSGIPAVHDGTVYAVDDARGRPDSVPSVRAIDLETGEERWRWVLDANAVFAPAVADEGIYVRTDASLVSLSRSDGTVRWALDEPGNFGDMWYETTMDVSPLVLDDHVVFPSGDGLVAVTRDTAEVAWRTDAEKVRAAPSSDGEHVFYSDVANGIRAVSAADGETLWSYEAVGCSTTPAVGDGRVVGSTGLHLVSLDPQSGDEQWRSDSLHGDIYTSPVLDGDRIIAGSISSSAVSLDSSSGDIEWRFGKGTRQSPSMIDGTAFVVGHVEGDGGQPVQSVVAIEQSR